MTPDEVEWIDASEEQLERLRTKGVATGEMHRLNPELLPGCYLHRTASQRRGPCGGPHLHLLPQARGRRPHQQLDGSRRRCTPSCMPLYDGAMKGRTMYVIPYSMGPVGSPFAKYGIELTDSIYVVLNMAIMTRVGKAVLDAAGRQSDDFVRGLHSKADLDAGEPLHRPLPRGQHHHGPSTPATAATCCWARSALRCASPPIWAARRAGWPSICSSWALRTPRARSSYVTAAFPSACGKTNLAMLIPPEVYRKKGYKVWTRGRRHRLAAHRRRRPPVGHQPGERLLRRCPRHQREVQPQRPGLHPEEHHLHQRGAQPGRQHRLVGRPGQESARSTPWTGRAIRGMARPAPRRAPIPTAASPPRPRTAPASAPSSTIPEGVPISAIIFGGRRGQDRPAGLPVPRLGARRLRRLHHGL